MKSILKNCSGIFSLFLLVTAYSVESREGFASESGEVSSAALKAFKLGSDYLQQDVSVRKSNLVQQSSARVRLEDVIRASNDAVSSVIKEAKRSSPENLIPFGERKLSLAAVAVRLDSLRLEVMKAPLQQCEERQAKIERPEGASKDLDMSFIPKDNWGLVDCTALSEGSRVEGKVSERALGNIKEFCEGSNFYLGKATQIIRAGHSYYQWDLRCEKAPKILDGYQTQTKSEYFLPHQPCGECSKWAQKVNADPTVPALRVLLAESLKAPAKIENEEED